MQGCLLEADSSPVVQKCGAYFSIELDRSIIPIENIEHDSEAVSFFHYLGNTRQQRPPNILPTKPWSDKEVFQENARALKGRIVVEEEGVARRWAVDLGNQYLKLWPGSESILAELLLDYYRGKPLVCCK